MTKRRLNLSKEKPLDSARVLIRENYMRGKERTIFHLFGEFYEWDGKRYIVVRAEEINSVVYDFLDGAGCQPNKSKVAEVVSALAATVQLRGPVAAPAWLDSAEHPPANEMLVCSNGVLHLPTLQLYEHSPALFTLNALDYDFDPNAAKPVNWDAFLRSVFSDDQQSIETLQEMFGLFLTGDTRYQKIFMIVGPKRSGKGTIGRVLVALLGRSNVASPTLNAMTQNFGLQPLIGKQLAIISDARISFRADQQVVTERLLTISGEDDQTIDRKYLGAWIGRLSVRLLMLSNELPSLRDASGALASRFIVLRSINSFYGVEDHGLLDRLLPELPGILNWAIIGRQRLVDRGHFVQPVSSKQAVEEMEELGSPIQAFLKGGCVEEPSREVEVGIFYEGYKEWCVQQGMRCEAAPTFGRDLRAARPMLKLVQHRDGKERRVRYYQGIDLAPAKSA